MLILSVIVVDIIRCTTQVLIKTRASVLL